LPPRLRVRGHPCPTAPTITREGCHESLWAEFLGTFTLCFIGQGCHLRQPDGRRVGSRLVGDRDRPWSGTRRHDQRLGAVSGGHFNLAVTFGFVITGRQSVGSMIGYWIAQLAGAVVASALLARVFPSSVWQEARLGAAALAPRPSARARARSSR
jgi:hypothetical protein